MLEVIAVGHCRDTLGYLVVGHCRDTWLLGTAGILGGWALQGYLAVGHESQLPIGRGQHLL